MIEQRFVGVQSTPAFRVTAAIAFIAGLLVHGAPCGLSKAYSQPHALVTAGGPTGLTRTITFSPDGQQFVTGGDDKVLRVWSLEQRGESRFVDSTITQRFFWEVSRGPGGSIEASAISPDGKMLAFGGFSARDARSDISVYDLETRELIRVLTSPDFAGLHIFFLAFSGDGRKLVAGTDTGAMSVWDTRTWERTSIEIAHAGNPELIQRMQFVTATKFVVPIRINNLEWRLELRDINAPNQVLRTLRRAHVGFVTAIAKDPASDQWASADAIGNVFIWDGTSNPREFLLRDGMKDDGASERQRRRTVRSLAFDGEGRIFLTTQRERTRPAPAIAEVWSTSRRTKIDEIVLSHSLDSLASACDPHGNFFVTTSGENNDIAIFELRDQEGSISEKPLSSTRRVSKASRGIKPRHIAFDADSTYKIAISERALTSQQASDLSNYLFAFDLSAHELVEQSAAPSALRDSSNRQSWKLSVSNGGRTINIHRTERDAGVIELDVRRHGTYRSHCWLVDADDEVYGIAIGTGGVNGIFLYALPREGKCRLMRYCRDHQGAILSMSVSHDGKYLASSASDETVKVWSLDGLRRRHDEFDRFDAWGAVFQRRDADLLALEVSPGSIAERRGIREGDSIVRVRYVGNEGEVVEFEPTKMLRSLETIPLWRSIQISVIQDGVANRVLMKVAWQPILTLFIDRDREWIAWTPEGIYDASVSGDSVVRWVFNREYGEQPDVITSDRLRNDLEKPKVMQNLLGQGNLSDAFDVAGVAKPDSNQTLIAKAAERLPIIEIISPLSGQKLGVDDPLVINASLTFPDKAAQERYNNVCFVNGVALVETERVDKGLKTQLVWRADKVSGPLGRVSVVAMDEYTGASSRFAKADVYVRSDFRPPPFKVHMVTLTGDNYREHGLWSDLHGSENANRFTQAVTKAAAGPYFDMGSVTSLKNIEITPTRLGDLVSTIASDDEIKSNDLLIVYVGGHGVEMSGDYFFVPAVPGMKDGEEETVRRHGISWRLLREFGRVRCRKIFLLDTCRAPINKHSVSRKASVRPLQQFDSLVMTGPQQGQRTFELPGGKSIFTMALVEGLGGRADGAASDRPAPPDPDGTTDLSELSGFVVKRVLELVQENKDQRFSVPSEKEEFLSLKPYVGQTFLPHIPLFKKVD